MKKFVISVLFVLFAPYFFVSENFQSDVALFSELSSSYNSGFFPGTVQYASTLLKQFPETAYKGQVLAMQGESFVRLGQYEQAAKCLTEALKQDMDSSVKENIIFFLARSYDEQGFLEDSLSLYHKYCSLTKKNGTYYNDAIRFSGCAFYKLERYENAIKNLEYVVQNGKKYTSDEYFDSVLKLADSYNKAGKSQKTIELCENIKKVSDSKENPLPSFVEAVLTEYKGDAALNQKRYKEAYNCYISVLSGTEKSLSANALKKAYNVSSLHKKEVGEEPGEVLATAQKSLKENPELLAEFWARLGKDAFSEGDYEKAKRYFSESGTYEDPNIEEFSAMYFSEIELGKNPSKDSALRAEKLILEAQKKQSLLENPSWKNEYNALLVKYAAIQENWENVKSYAANIEPKNSFSEQTAWFVALAEYKTGDYSSAAKRLSNTQTQLESLSLARQQKFKEAATVYSNMEKSDSISPKERLDYSKVLILSGRYSESQIQAAKTGLTDGKYILGLAQFNTRSWNYAEESFSSYLKSQGKNSASKKEIPYAHFYLGYSQYRQGKSREAFNELEYFVKNYPNNELYRNALITASNAAVQLGRFDDGIRMVENAIKSSATNEQREEAVLLAAGIYYDAGRFEKAISVLEPYSKLKNDFGMKSLYQMAQVYEKTQDYSLADETYKETYRRFSTKKLGEEALYRRAELYYGLEDFQNALTRFNEYSSAYPSGSFVASSWYYAADCLSKIGNTDRAILQNQALIKKFPESTYTYSSSKKLIELYRQKQKYQEALTLARKLLSDYGEQARNDGLAETANQLEKLTSGKSEEIVVAETKFNQTGGINSLEGRIAGTELCVLYAKSGASSKDAVLLAEKLLPLQKKNIDSESLYAAQIADILGQAYRIQQKNRASAEQFLFAAECYRKNAKHEETCSVLYAAYDAYLAAELFADANETAKTLKALYPQSREAKNVKTDN